MFIVVAIVIFGIFVGLSYTLFGSEGPSNDLKGLFTTATEQANEKLINKEHVNYFPDTNFEDVTTIYNDFSARGTTSLAIDKDNLYLGNNTLHHTFLHEGGQFKHTDDVVLFMSSARFKNVIVDDYLTLSFNARASDEVDLIGRLGADFELGNFDEETGAIIDSGGYDGVGLDKITLGKDWNHYKLKFKVDMSHPTKHGKPAFVYWLDKAGEIWLSDVRIEIGKEYIE